MLTPCGSTWSPPNSPRTPPPPLANPRRDGHRARPIHDPDPALQLIDEHLVAVSEGRCERPIINLAPQEGKSERTSRRFPLSMLHRNPNLRIAIMHYGHDVARGSKRSDGSRMVSGLDELTMSWDRRSRARTVPTSWSARCDAPRCGRLQVWARISFVETCQRFRELADRWPQAVLKLVEDKANGPR